MVKGSVNWHEWGLATIMLLVGAGFVVLGINGNLTLFFTGLFYVVIGLRGLITIRKRRISSQIVESEARIPEPVTGSPTK